MAWALTLVAFGDLAGRVFFLVFSKWIKIESQVIYLFGMLITVLSRIGEFQIFLVNYFILTTE